MVSKKVLGLVPYTAGEQPKGGFIKLNTNENPYPPSKEVDKALKSFDASDLRLYPDPDATALKNAIAKKENVDPDNIFIGNGSDEVLGFAFLGLFDDSVAFADITYSFYPVYCNLYGLKEVRVPLKKDFTLDLSDYKSIKAGGVVITNPNAPTSKSVKSNDIIDLVRARQDVNFIVDEAYIDFATKTKSVSDMAVKLDNLLVVKTFSKSYSMAGIRCGYAVGSKELIGALETIKNCFNSYTIDMVCQKTTLASLNDTAYFKECVDKVIKVRDSVASRLAKDGHTVVDSDANFIFVSHKSIPGGNAYKALKEKGILVRHWDKEKISNYVRVTIGTDGDMKKFVEEFNKL